MKLKIITLSIILQALLKFFNLDWNFLIWLTICIVLDLITGITKAYVKKKPINSKGLRNTVGKIVNYGSFLLITHVLINFEVNGKKWENISFIGEWAYVFLIIIEIKSVYENIIEINPKFNFMKEVITKLTELVKNKGAAPMLVLPFLLMACGTSKQIKKETVKTQTHQTQQAEITITEKIDTIIRINADSLTLSMPVPITDNSIVSDSIENNDQKVVIAFTITNGKGSLKIKSINKAKSIPVQAAKTTQIKTNNTEAKTQVSNLIEKEKRSFTFVPLIILGLLTVILYFAIKKFIK